MKKHKFGSMLAALGVFLFCNRALCAENAGSNSAPGFAEVRKIESISGKTNSTLKPAVESLTAWVPRSGRNPENSQVKAANDLWLFPHSEMEKRFREALTPEEQMFKGGNQGARHNDSSESRTFSFVFTFSTSKAGDLKERLVKALESWRNDKKLGVSTNELGDKETDVWLKDWSYSDPAAGVVGQFTFWVIDARSTAFKMVCTGTETKIERH
jgi:hypothetical protein